MAVNKPHVSNDDVLLHSHVFVSAGPLTDELDGKAPKGALLIDKTNAVLYINTGTKASNTWTVVGDQTATP